MIRPFNLRDLPLLRRLSEQGVFLHTESALANNLSPLREALFSLVGGDYPTYVWKLDQGPATGFIQLMLEENEQHARIIYISPNDEAADSGEDDNEQISNEDVWLPLLDQAVIEVGSRGIHSLIAEVSETGAELLLLRRAGFAIYTRQDIWRLDVVDDPPAAHLELAPRRPVDDWDIQLLYGNMVPRLVQLVEPVPPLSRGGGWLLRENGELTAFGHLRFGSIATWLRLFIHPNAEAQADEIVAAMVQVARRKAARPIYCCVRRYQSWLQRPLQDAGFVHCGSQAVMVKHTVHHLSQPLPEMSAALDPQRIPASAPMIPRYDRSRVNGKANK
jgi:hypothetical protein